MLLFVVTHHALFRVQPDGINLTLSGCQACDDPLSGTPTCLEALNAALQNSADGRCCFYTMDAWVRRMKKHTYTRN